MKRSVRITEFLAFVVVSFVVFSSSAFAKCADIQAWLTSHPKVLEAIRWEGNFDRMELCNVKAPPDPISNLKKLKDADFATTVFSTEDAKAYYLSSVASALELEVSGKLGWSITEMPPEALAPLFDSRQFFEWRAAENGYVIDEEKHGLSSPSSPALTLAFLKREKLIGKTRRETINNVLTWSRRLTHDISTQATSEKGFYRETTYFLESFWKYRGFPPARRVFEGTKQTLDPTVLTEVRNWTAGCWGTAGFLKSVFRAVNIPAEVRRRRGHAGVYFPTEKLVLFHADDPYDREKANTPVEKLLVSPDEEPAPKLPVYVDVSWYETMKKKFEPPSRESTTQAADELELEKLQKTRTDEACKQAHAEMQVTLQSFYGISNKDITPFFDRVKTDGSYFLQRLKKDYPRPRPYAHMVGMSPCLPKETTGSYPSGHALHSKVFALILTDLYPAQKQKWEERAQAIADHRVISAMHHRSDVDAGRGLAVMFYEQLKKSPKFQADFAKVKSQVVR